MKEKVTKFWLYMLNRWCEAEARKAFASAPCGWSHVWGIYARAIEDYRSREGAAAAFFFSLDEKLQTALCDHIESTYGG